ncbi:hypothetical protein RVR34_15770 [Microcystis aeruginosa FBCC-A68]
MHLKSRAKIAGKLGITRVCGKKFFVGVGCRVWGVGCGVLPIFRWSIT